jgi:hypothetical protein
LIRIVHVVLFICFTLFPPFLRPRFFILFEISLLIRVVRIYYNFIHLFYFAVAEIRGGGEKERKKQKKKKTERKNRKKKKKEKKERKKSREGRKKVTFPILK